MGKAGADRGWYHQRCRIRFRLDPGHIAFFCHAAVLVTRFSEFGTDTDTEFDFWSRTRPAGIFFPNPREA